MKTSQYKTNWEGYWSKLFDDQDKALWDTQPDLAVVNSLPRFKDAFGQNLPVIDFGCGNGTQTFFLAEQFNSVIGVDVAEAAINQAHLNNPPENLSFEVLDGTNHEEVQMLHSKVGDANIYMRGILHQICPEDQVRVIESLQTLIGKTGTLYLSELSPQTKDFFNDLIRQMGAPPPQLARVFQHGIKPADISPEKIRSSFTNDNYLIVNEGKTLIATNYIFPDGNRLQITKDYR